MKCYRLHLIRHGMTDGNINGQYIGVTDLPLNTNGINMLEDRKNEGIYPGVEAVYSSPLLRCTETAKIIYPNKSVKTVEELKEYDFGDFEGKTAAELELTEDYKLWTSGKLPAPPNGEDNRKFAYRICLGINRVVVDMSQNGTYEAAVIMHGGAIMSLLSVSGMPQKNIMEWTSDFGCGYTVLVTPSLYAKSGVIEVIDQIPTIGG